MNVNSVHLIGIGGMALSGIAGILLEQGARVSGSDMVASSYTKNLVNSGARVHIVHDAANIYDAELVIYSAAIPSDNPEMIRASELGIPMVRRAEFIGRLLDSRTGIAVAGTHGKTTTTAMLATILKMAGKDPGYMVGAAVLDLNGNSAWGNGAEFVVEADEYDSAFLEYKPHIAIINHLEPDHLDYFGDFKQILTEFRQLVSTIEPKGTLLARNDVPAIDEVTSGASCRVVRFGETGNWQISNYRQDGWGSRFNICPPSGNTVNTHLSLPGKHNALNALAAVAAAAEVGITPAISADVLARFSGADRRFQLLIESHGIQIVSDYAHHPTEIRASLAAAKPIARKRLWVIFQPHLRSRTKALFADFTTAFVGADRVTVTEIFSPPGRETDNLSGNDLAEAITSPKASFRATLQGCFSQVVHDAREGDLIMVMGAGDIDLLGERIRHWLQS